MVWQDDGWSWRARIGVLTPHADVGPEVEFQAMAPAGVSIHAGRVPFPAMAPGGAMDPTIALEHVRRYADPPDVDNAIELLAAAPLDAIAYAFTSSSYVRGASDDVLLKTRLEQRTRGIPVVITCTAAVAGLRAVGAQHMALIDPPWFSKELNTLGAQYFTDQGFDVVHAAPAALLGGQFAVHPGSLYAWAKDNIPKEADAVFIGGNGLRAVGVIKVLEEDLGIVVLTSNQVAMWQALRLARCRAPMPEYGRLFDH